MVSPRNFDCAFEATPCTDPRCKAGQCVREREQRAEQERLAGTIRVAESIELREHARKFAAEILRARKIRPTDEKIEALAEHPKVLDEARRRIEWLRGAVDKESTSALAP